VLPAEDLDSFSVHNYASVVLALRRNNGVSFCSEPPTMRGMGASQNAVWAKFAEFTFHALR
jgi:hypothetical protein